MLSNPFCTPSELYKDYKDCYSSPQPTKKRHHGDAFNNAGYTLAGVKVPKSPRVSENLSDEEYLVQIGKKVDDIRNEIQYHEGRIKTLTEKKSALFHQLGERYTRKSQERD